MTETQQFKSIPEIERIARALCVADGGDPDEGIYEKSYSIEGGSKPIGMLWTLYAKLACHVAVMLASASVAQCKACGQEMKP